MPRTGRCLCGKITYEFSGDPIATAVCHCSHCQRQGGSAFSVNLIAHESQLKVSGDLTTYNEMGEKGDQVYVRRRFCSSCGSPIVSEIALSDGVIAIKVGTLDDTSDIVPNVEAWCVDRQPWVTLPEMPIVLERE
jgi:hypothetical protein